MRLVTRAHPCPKHTDSLSLPSGGCGVSSASDCLPSSADSGSNGGVFLPGVLVDAAFSSVNGGRCVFLCIGETACHVHCYSACET
ncbi:hypothetical protein MUK42_07914 [Musa troglodytarum]|uniref:Uncharacterized protein n=1 Tax=Musa troglodytarum TaxID=320322 RepID=A0A9E7HSN4_9LILI|nr:hypothetical protein MUK42_07914 [Musa troglodytarum]